MLGASGCDVSANLALGQGGEVRLAAVTGIGRGFLWLAAEIVLIPSMSGTSWSWSLMLCVRLWATMIWAPASTAAWAL